MMHKIRLALLLCLALPSLLSAEGPAKEAYVPGLGEFMTLTQLRHAKLWFAGKAKNWDLARYEVDELKEGLEDAARLYPAHEGVPVAAMIEANMMAPLDSLAAAVEEKSPAKFEAGFDALTAACNVCHAGAKREFIKIRRPTVPPFSNQQFGTR